MAVIDCIFDILSVGGPLVGLDYAMLSPTRVCNDDRLVGKHNISGCSEFVRTVS